MKHIPDLYRDIKKHRLLSNRARDVSYLTELLLEKDYVPEASLWESSWHYS